MDEKIPFGKCQKGFNISVKYKKQYKLQYD